MSRQLVANRSGTTALEFALIGLLAFSIIFGIFDIGRYALTLMSLTTLADESARQEIICYAPRIATGASVSCSGDPLNAGSSSGAGATVAPFLYFGGLTPTVSTSTTAPHVVTASQPNFKLIFLPITVASPSISVTLPF